jgi:mRNA interferase HicA
VKRGKLIRALVAAGCYLKRHGKKHDICVNPNNGSADFIVGWSVIGS